MAIEQLSGTQVQARVDDLQKKWISRKPKFKEWYDLLNLVDALAESSMESFVGNDPRTFYNMSLHLLTPQKVLHKIPVDPLTPEQVPMASSLERLCSAEWKIVDRNAMASGKGRWIEKLASLMILTGWASVYSLVQNGKMIREVWHPLETFPVFGVDGLIECGHKYTITAVEANKRIADGGLPKPVSPFTSDVTISDYWAITEDGVAEAVAYNNHLAIPLTVDSKLEAIPILCLPMGGLPDWGQLTTDWARTMGQGIFAANEPVYKSYNKQRTFLQQMMRDTAQPRWWEKSRGTKILDQNSIFTRGAIFRMLPEESIGTLPVPPIPVELSTSIFDVQNQIQRGGFPYSMHGNVQQQISGYVISQISSAAQQVLHPYYQAMMFILSYMDNTWLDGVRKNLKLPKGVEIDKKLITPEFEFDTLFHLVIPGDFEQRSQTARMLNPEFKISSVQIMDRLFPEIEDPQREMAKINAEMALAHPMAQTVNLINSLYQQAKVLTAAGMSEESGRYAAAAKALETQLGQQSSGNATSEETPTQPVQPIPPEQLQ